MKPLFLLILFFSLLAFGCHTAKQAQVAIKADTVHTQSPAVTLKQDDTATVDPSNTLKQKISDIINAPLDFETFYGKAKANFSSPDAGGNVTVYIKMKKDSVIIISITGPLSIPGGKVLITPDSVKIVNQIDHTAEISSIAHLQEITKIPLTFSDFQNIILGKPVVNSTGDLDYQIKEDSITVTATSELLKYIYSFTKDDLQLGQSNFQTEGNRSVTTANIFYNDYHAVNNINFSASRDIDVTGSSPANLQIHFKEYNFNQPQNFVFSISKNYSVKYE